LEALQPPVLQRILSDALLRVIDPEAFKAEVEGEKEDAAHLEAKRRKVRAALLEDFDNQKNNDSTTS